MARLILMPVISANTTHATLSTWRVRPGDEVVEGDCLAEIETDKATVELPAEEPGVVGEQLVSEGQEVEVGTPICVLLSERGEVVDIGTLLATAAAGGGGPAGPSMPAGSAPAARSGPPASPAPRGRTRSSPLARRLARERGVDLTGMVGRGPDGRVVRRDVEAAAPARASAYATPGRASAISQAATPGRSAFTEVPHTRTRQAIARRLSESKATIPHFYLSADLRVDGLVELRRELNEVGPASISVNDFVVRAAALALVQVPDANVSWTETAMRHFHSADVAIAVATDGGLITPVVRAAETKPLSILSSEIADLAERARSGRVRPEEYEGGSFTVSNLGMFGVEAFSAIINPPQSAILAVGAARRGPVVESDSLSVGTIMSCTLSVDHRAVDGAQAARWLAAFRQLIENPLRLLV